MGPKPTPIKQSNTLFSYFNKSPAAKSLASDHTDVLSSKSSPNKSDERAVKRTAGTNSCQYQVGDLVWSKLEGYPWWPSLVCNHPTDSVCFKKGKQPQVHVQFFDDPVSRSWIKLKNVLPFKGADDKDCQRGGQFFSHNPKVKNGIEEADKAMSLSIDERLKLVVELLPSDEDEDESMDLDPDIFDDEMDEDIKTSGSKENLNGSNEENVSPSKKSTSKSPSKKKRRSTRPPKTKRRRIIVSADSEEESEDEFKPEDSEHSESESDVSSGVNESDVSDVESEESVESSPIKKAQAANKRKRPPPKAKTQVSSPEASSSKPSAFTPSVGDKTKSKLSAFTAAETITTSGSGISEQESNFPHLKLPFLQPDKIKDAKGHLKSDPDYNERTLYIPDSFLKTCTPALRQWWDFKSQFYDTVLFFKMGKFYELFHMDAVIGVNELGLIYMKGEHAHSGFPEIAYNRYADTLVQKGYKVARIEQTETPDMMEKRIKNSSKVVTKFDKVVKREICRVTARGTQTFSFLDGDCSESNTSFLLAICEKEEETEGKSQYGVCFVDTSIGKFHIGQFSDDRHCSRLRTLIAHFTPSQILFERGKMSQKTHLVLKNNLNSALKEALKSGSEFWESSKTLKVLAEEDYFKENETFEWPAVLKKMIADCDAIGLSAADGYILALRALGAVTWYLQYSLLDQELLSMKSFEEYSPLDDSNLKASKDNIFSGRQHMVLDGVTLSNLDITENSSTGTMEGTLLERLDACCTPFGHRLFRQWLCAPLCNPVAINDRLDAVEDLIDNQDLMESTRETFKKLPDLERLLNRIHSLGSASKSENHPDARAIMFDEVKYSKKKIEDFLMTIDAFKSLAKVISKFQDHVQDFKSKLLKKTVTFAEENNKGYFPDLSEDLKHFENAFDQNKARKDGVIVPNKGVDPLYDKAVSDIKSIEQDLNMYLESQRTRIACKSMVYWGSGKNRYQLEVPEVAFKRVPNDYELFSSKKGAKRYRTSEIDKLLYKLTDAEDRKDSALKDTMRRIFHSYDERYNKWSAAIQCTSVLDVLMSLAFYSRCGDGVMCRPGIVPPSKDTQPFIEIIEGRHPCISRTFSGGDFIPNDTCIGKKDSNQEEEEQTSKSDESKIILVTGPNMGGKSTLMRQVGLICIMSQLGCYVPAEKCQLTPVDRVFTRLGASDRIMAGESTFFVELSETSAILQHATEHSLVLMDELGRGTATYDGTAIACAVVQELSNSICCRTLFSTHYHSLVEEFSHDANVRLGHMACMVENEDESDPTQETITFLYKLTKGACPKSYGFNAAKLANLPDEVIRLAVKKAKEFESACNRMTLARCLWQEENSIDSIKGIQEQI